MSTHIVELLAESTTAATGDPVYMGPNAGKIAGSGSHLFQGGQPVILEVDRAGTTGTAAVWGMDCGDVNGVPSTVGGNPTGQTFKGDASTTNFQSAIPYVALSNNNWIVVVAGVVLTQAQISAITSVTVAGVAMARIDLAAAPALGAEILVFNGTPVNVYVAAGARIKKTQIRSYDFMWTVLASTPSATSIHIRPCGDN